MSSRSGGSRQRAKRPHTKLVLAEEDGRKPYPQCHHWWVVEIAPSQMFGPERVVRLVEHQLEVGIEPKAHKQQASGDKRKTG